MIGRIFSNHGEAVPQTITRTQQHIAFLVK
jgi:hypothetical protein